uniref:Uncharacterized protein n=1 Tax=Candidatus Kentrum sp. FW TaxID=2126338 RepID=A0A450RYN3_9GAMM|nr:MAG: hypothetical protein BECKFW1821A_GA0114235_100639 [Candidatus Kentron sp. FW]
MPVATGRQGRLPEGSFSLIGEVVAPGFEYRDNAMAEPDGFKALFPGLWDEISPYTTIRPLLVFCARSTFPRSGVGTGSRFFSHHFGCGCAAPGAGRGKTGKVFG